MYDLSSYHPLSLVAALDAKPRARMKTARPLSTVHWARRPLYHPSGSPFPLYHPLAASTNPDGSGPSITHWVRRSYRPLASSLLPPLALAPACYHPLRTHPCLLPPLALVPAWTQMPLHHPLQSYPFHQPLHPPLLSTPCIFSFHTPCTHPSCYHSLHLPLLATTPCTHLPFPLLLAPIPPFYCPLQSWPSFLPLIPLPPSLDPLRLPRPHTIPWSEPLPPCLIPVYRPLHW